MYRFCDFLYIKTETCIDFAIFYTGYFVVGMFMSLPI